MDIETTRILIAALGGPAALGAGGAIWKTVDWWVKKRAELESKRIEAKAADDAREDDTVKILLRERGETEKRNAERITRLEARVDDCEKRHDDCDKQNADLRVELGMVIKDNDQLRERMTRVERRTTPPQPMEAAFLRAAKDEDEG